MLDYKFSPFLMKGLLCGFNNFNVIHFIKTLRFKGFNTNNVKNVNKTFFTILRKYILLDFSFQRNNK